MFRQSHEDQCSVVRGSFSSAREATEEEFFEMLKIKERIDPECTYIGQSLALLRVSKQIAILNRDPTKPVLIYGPTGSGKTQLGELIYKDSKRPGGYCLEQATDDMAGDFSITKGRWVGFGKGTGLPNIPREGQRGILQQYAGGTIFVDEIHHARREFQVFLLRILDGRPLPVAAGVGKDVTPDVRLIFATNVDPAVAVANGLILPDLYRVIKTRVLVIPAMADRMEDIPLFVRSRCDGYRWSPGFLLCLLQYPWPGNVGELLDVLDLAMNQAGRKGTKLTPYHLTGFPQSLVDAVCKMPKEETDAAVFRTLWLMLERQGWRPCRRGRALQTQLAKLMGVSAATITRLARRHIGPKAGALA
jgi:DNA-binding NtrC family response regulator